MLRRASKEVRLLLPAAALAAGAAIVSAVTGQNAWMHAPSIRLLILSFYAGTALVASTSFGSEFQQRTFMLLLSQPLERTRLWLEKWIVLVIVSAVVVAVQFAAMTFGPWTMGADRHWRELLYFVAVLCSAPLWTFVARSTIGGLAFSMAVLFMVNLGTALALQYLGYRNDALDIFEPSRPFVTVEVVYSTLTLLAGWWMFTRFQLKEATGAELMSTERSWPVLRARPTGALANMIRKELRLQRPTLLIASVFVLCWFSAMPAVAATSWRPASRELVFLLMLLAYVPLVTVLAGTVAVGEETTLGTRAWHLTLPVSARQQWTVKLVVALVLAMVLGFLLPDALGALAARSGAVGRNLFDAPWNWLLVPCGAILSFWAAAVVGHTVRAAIAVGLTILGIVVVNSLAMWCGDHLTAPFVSMFNQIMVLLELPPHYIFQYPKLANAAFAALILAAALVVLRQSLVAFKRAPTGTRQTAAAAARLIVTMFLILVGWHAVLLAANKYVWSGPAAELRNSMWAVFLAERGKPAAAREITLEQLEATGKLSSGTRRWLAHTRIVATPEGLTYKGWPVYRVTIDFPRNRRFVTGIVVSDTQPRQH